jgi:molecular chaperone HscB
LRLRLVVFGLRHAMAIQRDSATTDGKTPPATPYVMGEGGKIDLTRNTAPGEPPPDHFAVLGVPRRLLLDPQHLEVRMRSLVRDLHPDRFHQDGPAAVADAQRHTSLVNDAWRTLRELESRARYVLALDGARPDEKFQPPPAFLAEMMELNETLDDLKMALTGDAETSKSARWQLRQHAGELEELREESTGALKRAARRWDDAETSGDAGAKAEARKSLRAALGQLSYLDNLTERVRALQEGGGLLPRGRAH